MSDLTPKKPINVASWNKLSQANQSSTADQLVKSIDLLTAFFQGNKDKVAAWLSTKNPNLGKTTPLDLFFRGRGHKVLLFIKSSLEENKP